jgi:hypothetical protein
MNAILASLGVFVGLTTATVVFALDSDSTDETSAALAGIKAAASLDRPAATLPEVVYMPYEEDGLQELAPGCKWVRMALYDSENRLIGWRGDPVGVCP